MIFIAGRLLERSKNYVSIYTVEEALEDLRKESCSGNR